MADWSGYLDENRSRFFDELFAFVRRDMQAALDVMGERPVTIRLLDPTWPQDRDLRRA